MIADSFVRLHVGLDERSEHPVLLLQEGLGFVVLQNVPPLHHDDQVGREDGVDAVLETEEEGKNTEASDNWNRKTPR